MKIVCQ